MRKLVAKNIDGKSSAFQEAKRYLLNNRKCSILDIDCHEHTFTNYVSVKDKPYRVYLIETPRYSHVYSVYYFSTPSEYDIFAKEQKKKEAKEWKKKLAPPIPQDLLNK